MKNFMRKYKSIKNADFVYLSAISKISVSLKKGVKKLRKINHKFNLGHSLADQTIVSCADVTG